MRTFILTIITSLFLISGYAQNIENFCEGWTQGLGEPGLSDPAEAMISDTHFDRLYIGGAGRYGGIPSFSTLAYFDRDLRWHSIGNFKCTSCGSGQIETLIVDDSSYLYIGGFFEGVEDMQGNYVASKNVIRFNPYTDKFEALGLGLEANSVYDLAWRNDTLFAGGRITFAKNTTGDLAVNNMALFDFNTQTWHAMGQGIGSHFLSTDDNGDVHALTIGEDGYLYAGGRFSKINGTDTVFSVAKWSPAAGWEDLNERIFLAYTQTSLKYPPLINDLVYAGGNHQELFATGVLGYSIGGENVLAMYDGQNWQYIGAGKPNSTGGIYRGYELNYTEWLDEIHIGGNFNTFNDDPANPAPGNYILTYQLSQDFYFDLDGGLTQAAAGPEVSSITYWGRVQGDLFFSGNFTEADSVPVNFITRYKYGWPEGQHTNTGQGAHDQCDEIRALNYFNRFDKFLIVGGKFSKIGDIYANSLAAYDPDEGFSPLYGAELKRDFSDPIVNDVFIDNLKNIWVGGRFDSLYHTIGTSLFKRNTPGLAVYRSFLGLWVPTFNSLGGNGEVFAISQFKGEMVVGGDFTDINGTPAKGLAFQDTSNSSWVELAQIDGGRVEDILNVGDSLLYIAGTFSQVNGQNIAGVAVYDGTSWSGLGQNFAFYDDVYALGWDSLNNELIVGGFFDRVRQSNGNDLMTEGLAFWDGTTWSTRGSVSAQFTSPPEYAPIVHSIASRGNGEIFIGGEFSGINGVNAERIAKWLPGIGWQALKDGGVRENSCFLSQNPAVKALHVSEKENKLFLGGTFNQSGLEQAGKFASYGLGANPETPIIDSHFTLACFPLYIRADSSFKNIHWSFGGNDYWQEIPQGFMTAPERWLYVGGERNGCYYRDSLLMVRGQNINVSPYLEYRWRVDTNSLTVALWFPRAQHFNDTLSIDYGDGTIITYSRALGTITTTDTFYHTYASAGIYNTRVHNGNFCASWRRDTTFNFSTTAMSQQLAVGISLYPNPNSGRFQLQTDISFGPTAQIEIFELMGRSLWRAEMAADRLKQGEELQLTGLASGTYLLKLGNERLMGQKLLVIE